MNALLIYPEFPETFWSFKHALKFVGKRAAQPPLGLMTVAALLPRAWKKRLVDTNVEALRERDLSWADVVLLSGMHIQSESLLAIVERCRARGLRTVVGGPIASSVPAAELEGRPRGDRRSREPDCRSGAGTGRGNGTGRLSGRRNGRR